MQAARVFVAEDPANVNAVLGCLPGGSNDWHHWHLDVPGRIATALVKVRIAPLAAWYGADVRLPTIPYIDETLTIEPPP
jgi:hypothetical protein